MKTKTCSELGRTILLIVSLITLNFKPARRRLILLLLAGGLQTLNCSAQHWTFLGFPNEQINAIAVHPTNPNIIFCAGMDIYKSSDCGTNWDTVSDYSGFNSITFHPGNPDTMYVTLGIGSLSDGIYKSIDGGNNWDILEWMWGATSLVKISYGGMLVASTKGGGVYKSTDYGNNWTQINDSLDNLNVLSLTVVYPVCIPEDPIIGYIAGTEGGIFYYPDHTLLNSPDEYWHNTNTATNASVPAISSAELIGGSNIWAAIDGGSWSDGMYQSADYGASWNVSDYWPWITDILINPLNQNTIYAADSGYGVKRTINGGISWQLINAGLGDSVVYCLAQSPADTTRLYAGTSGGVYVLDLSTKIQKISNENNIAVYPNPVSEYAVFNIEGLPLNQAMELTLYDVMGSEIKHIVFYKKYVLSHAGLPSGVYFYNISCNSSLLGCGKLILK